jgi:D-aspartate ligase
MSDTAPPAPAVVLSGDITPGRSSPSLNEAALALTRSLGRRGVRVLRFHPDTDLADLGSRYCTHHVCPNLYENPLALVDALVGYARSTGTTPVLFPASDGASRFVAEHAGTLRAHFALTSPSSECIARTQNKRSLLEVAERIGIGVPVTHFPQSLDELDRVSRATPYPVVVKPLYSTAWKSTRATRVLGSVKAVTVEGPAELLALGQQALPLGSPIMVQEIIPGPEESLLTFIGHVGRNGRVLAGCVRKKLRQWPPGFGYCTLTDSTDDEEIASLSEQLLRALDYRGIGCVEFKRDERTSEPRLVEANARAVRTTALATAAGVDVPWIAYLDATGADEIEPVLQPVTPVRWMHVYDEMKAAGSLLVSGRLETLEWLGSFRGRRLVTAEFSWDDPRPALTYWSSRRPLKKLMPDSARPSLEPAR